MSNCKPNPHTERNIRSAFCTGDLKYIARRITNGNYGVRQIISEVLDEGLLSREQLMDLDAFVHRIIDNKKKIKNMIEKINKKT